jgi:hypothetical protein
MLEGRHAEINFDAVPAEGDTIKGIYAHATDPDLSSEITRM